jgi:hypothetical protein
VGARAVVAFVVVAGTCAAFLVANGAAGPRAEAGSAPSGVLIATGHLTDDRGRPQSGEVRAYLLPNGGPRIQRLREVARTQTDESGRFELRIQRPERLAALARLDRSAALTVHGFTDSGFGVFGLSTRITRRAAGAQAFAASLPQSAASLPQFGVQSGVPELKIKTTPPAATAASAAHPCEDQGDVGAPKLHRRTTYKKGMIIGELNNAYPDTRADFHYGERADSWVTRKIDVGPGGFKFNGWDHVDNSREAETGQTDARGPYARRFRSNFYYEEATYHVCPYPGSGSTYREVRALRWSGGLSSRRQAGTIGVCTGGNDYQPGSYFARSSKRAVKWSPGVSLELPGISVGLESVSGFSRWVKTRFDFGSQIRRHRLCGSGHRDESVAGRIYSGAQSRPPT